MKRFLAIIFAATLVSTQVFAGNPERAGQAGATQLLINSWARSAGYNGINIGSVYGIESIIDGQDLIDLDALYPEVEPNFYQASRSMVDYIYWGLPSTPEFSISNMPSWFKMDNVSDGSETHLEKYEVEGLVI